MTAMSNYLENELLDHTLATAAFTAPSSVWMALFTDNPDEDASGTEVSGGSYARKEITFAAASGGSASNSGAVTFPAPTGDWGTITHAAIFDAETTGNMLFYGALNSSIVVENGDAAPSFLAGAITVTMD